MIPTMRTTRNLPPILCSAVLLLLLQSPKCLTSKIDFYDEKNFQKHLYGTDNVPNPAECQNLAYFVLGRASSITTKVCVYVYLSEDCQGDPCKLTPGNYANLLALDNRGVSFRACDTPGEKHEERARVKLFAEPDYKNMIVDDPLKGCETLHRSIWNTTSSIMTKQCLVLFDDEACTGNIIYQLIGNAAKLPLIDKAVKSFRPCVASEQSTQSVAFFGDHNFQKHLYTTEKIPPPSSCQTLPYWMHSGVFSMKTSVCISLFYDEDCQGNEFEVPAGEYAKLPELDHWVKSYHACDNYRTGRDIKFYVDFRVKFYLKAEFTDLILDETITPECQSLHESLWDQTLSVITSTCIVLYSNPDCSGGRTTRVMQNVTLLPEYVKLKSFRPCDSNQLYGPPQLFGKIIKFEINADESETDKKSVTDYVEMTQKTRFRNDGPATQTQRYESHKVTKDKVEIDVITSLLQMTELRVTDTVTQDFTKQFGKSLNKGFKKLANLRGSAAGFKSYQKGKTDTDTKEKTKGDTVETGASVTSALFASRNNATTMSGPNPINETSWMAGLGSIGPIVDIGGQGSRRSRNRPASLPFQTAVGDGNAASTINTMGDQQQQDSFQGYLQGTLNKQDSQTLENRVASADAKDKRKTKEKMWMGQKEIGGEFTGARGEQQEMQDKIGSALVTGYQGSATNQSSFSNKITKEEEKGFTVDQTISIPPCTEYEVTSFVKRTKNFPAEYSVFVEVTGKWGKNGPAMTNEEIGRKLGGMEVVTWKDKQTVVVMGTASLVVDFSWFSVWNGKGTRIAGCDDGTKSRIEEENEMEKKNENIVEFYDWPYLSGLMYKDGINGDCQMMPSHVKNKVESIYTTSCVILFPNAKCELVDARNVRNIGYTLKVNPDHGITLPSYENVAQSFQACETFEKKLIYDRNKIKFYGKDTKAPLLSAPVAQTCSNLPKRTRRIITSVVVDNCVTLFSEGDCKGENFTVRPHSGVRLWDHFGGKAESFKSCASYPDETLQGYANYNNSNSNVLGHDRVRMYEDEKHSELVLDEPLRSTCVTLSKVDWGKTRYIKTDKCITIYTQPLCQGQGVEVVPEFSKYVFYIPFASFAPCEKVETDEHNEIDRVLWSGNLVK